MTRRLAAGGCQQWRCPLLFNSHGRSTTIERARATELCASRVLRWIRVRMCVEYTQHAPHTPALLARPVNGRRDVTRILQSATKRNGKLFLMKIKFLYNLIYLVVSCHGRNFPSRTRILSTMFILEFWSFNLWFGNKAVGGNNVSQDRFFVALLSRHCWNRRGSTQ